MLSDGFICSCCSGVSLLVRAQNPVGLCRISTTRQLGRTQLCVQEDKHLVALVVALTGQEEGGAVGTELRGGPDGTDGSWKQQTPSSWM